MARYYAEHKWLMAESNEVTPSQISRLQIYSSILHVPMPTPKDRQEATAITASMRIQVNNRFQEFNKRRVMMGQKPKSFTWFTGPYNKEGRGKNLI